MNRRTRLDPSGSRSAAHPTNGVPQNVDVEWFAHHGGLDAPEEFLVCSGNGVPGDERDGWSRRRLLLDRTVDRAPIQIRHVHVTQDEVIGVPCELLEGGVAIAGTV